MRSWFNRKRKDGRNSEEHKESEVRDGTDSEVAGGETYREKSKINILVTKLMMIRPSGFK